VLWLRKKNTFRLCVFKESKKSLRFHATEANNAALLVDPCRLTLPVFVQPAQRERKSSA
jgi:hypothetical protein